MASRPDPAWLVPRGARRRRRLAAMAAGCLTIASVAILNHPWSSGNADPSSTTRAPEDEHLGRDPGAQTGRRDSAPTKWTDVGILGYYDPVLGRHLTYTDLNADLTPLIESGVIRRVGDSYEVIAEGAEIVGYDFPEGTNLRVRAANVSLRRTRVRAGHWSKHAGAVYFQNVAPGLGSDGSASTVTIEDSELSGGKFGIYPSFQGVRLLARRNVVLANTVDPITGRATVADHDTADGIDWRGTHGHIDDESMASILEHNWIGGFVNGGSGHHYDGIAVVSGGNIKVLGNRIEGYGLTQTVGIRVVSDIGPVRNVWVEGNSVAGFGYSYALGWGSPTHSTNGELTNIYFRNNVAEAGTYSSGPLTVKHVDANGGTAMFNYINENNVCIATGSPLDLQAKWRSTDFSQLLTRCNDRF